MDQTPTGEALTAMRLALVQDHWAGDVVDIGIGGGRFVANRQKTWGFDVNPSAVDWLKTHGHWRDPYQEPVDAITCWDSLEHIHEPGPLLNNVRRFVFASLPIFDGGPDEVLRSKHYRKDEHCWYFTTWGLRGFMKTFGFEMIYRDNREEAAGREGIGSFVFSREKATS